MNRNVLIVKLAAIGDVVMATPMVTALQELDRGVTITWLCGRTVAPLVRRIEGVSEVIEVDEAALLAGSTPSKIVSVVSAWRRLARRFDAVYVAHSDARYRMLAWPATATRRRWLGEPRGLVPGRSHTDEYCRLVTGVDDHRARSFAFPAVQVELPSDLQQRLTAFNKAGRPLVAITPGGARNVARDNPLRRWPLARYGELADELERRGCGVVVIGDTTDVWVRETFRDRPVLDLIGATDLPSLAALLRLCRVVIGHDSGPMHIGRLVGTPTVTLLGPTPPSMFARPDRRTIYLWPGGALPCAPCYDGLDFARCDNNLCMQMIECSAVLDQVDRTLAAADKAV